MSVIGYGIDDQQLAIARDGTIEPFELANCDPLAIILDDAHYGIIQFAYHLDYFVARLLKAIGITEAEGKRLYNTSDLYLKGRGYKLGYRPGKYFSIRYGGSKDYALLMDIRQYILCPLPMDAPKAAEITRKTGLEVREAYTTLGFPTYVPLSPISVYEKARYNQLDIPTVDNIPDAAGELAYEACYGGWMEAFQLGHWNQVYDYDINSAYPSTIAMLYDLRQGRWTHSQIPPDDAMYGYARCIVNIDAPLHPVFYRAKDGNYAPTGIWDTVLTLGMMRFIAEYALGSYRVIDGWWWSPVHRIQVRPLCDEVCFLHSLRSKHNGMSRSIVKRMMTGLYGKMLEIHDNGALMGKYFNPVWAAEIETDTRIRLAKLCFDQNIMPLHITVDGVVTDKPLNIWTGDALGAWKLSFEGAALVLGTGLLAIDGKQGEGDFSLNYKHLMHELNDDLDRTEIIMHKTSPYTLMKTLALYQWDKLGTLEQTSRHIYLGSDTKRCFLRDMSKSKYILHKPTGSVPWDATMLRREELCQTGYVADAV